MRRKTHQLGAGYGRGYSRLGCGSPVFSDHSGLQHQKGTDLKTKVSGTIAGESIGLSGGDEKRVKTRLV